MTTVDNVAACIKRDTGASGMRLQKLCYYTQAWATVWLGRPLYTERIEAWRHGPVTPHLWQREQLDVGDVSALGRDDTDVIGRVLSVYGDKSAEWLSRLTHREDPWRKARGVLPPEAPSKTEITTSSMLAYYGAVQWGSNRTFIPEYLAGLDLLVELPEDEVALLLGDSTRLPADEYLHWMETGDL